MKKNILIVGAGFSGAVIAREIATRTDASIVVVDKRDHVGGNCHTERDASTGIMEHVYGPHIFHTSRKDVWDYVNQFSRFGAYTNRVKAQTKQGMFSLPINLLTINQFFRKTFSPIEAEIYISSLSDKTIIEPQNFEEQALKMVGTDLYENFFKGYTIKQWGCDPRELPASILKRLPLRFNYDDNYYNSKFQGIPEDGYTKLIERILEHSQIKVVLKEGYNSTWNEAFDYVFYSGPIDEYFSHEFGRLGYRTIIFERDQAVGDFQGNPVINFCERHVPFTRIHEHKHFAPWEVHEKTIYHREFSKETEGEDIPYYPKRLAHDMLLLNKYIELANLEEKVSFIGRLGTYRYLDMHQVIGESLDLAAAFLRHEGPLSAFSRFSYQHSFPAIL